MLFRQPNRPSASARVPSVDPGSRGARTAPWSNVRGVGSAWPIRLSMRAHVGLSQPVGFHSLESARVFHAPALRPERPLWLIRAVLSRP
jgi:hypothetical protein